MKRLSACFVAFFLAISLVACQGDTSPTTMKKTERAETTADEDVSTSVLEEPSTSAAAVESTTVKETVLTEDSAEKVKFSVTFLQNEWHGDPNEMKVLQNLAARANVEVEWQIYASSVWPDKKNLVLSGQDLPDVFYMNAVNSQDVAQYAPQGMFIELTSLIDEYAPRLTQAWERMPHYKSICINPDDGLIYVIGRGAERSVQYTPALHYINKVWLDQLGLDVPTTVDEFYTALKAFKDNDMNGNGDKDDEIPFSFHHSSENPKIDFDYSSLFGAFGLVDHNVTSVSHMIKDEEGNLVYTAKTDEYKTAIDYFSRFVAEGLWDKEGFTTPDTSILNAKGNNPDVILGSFMAFDSSFVVPAERINDYVIVEPLAGPDGARNWLYHAGSNGNVSGTQFAMTVAAKGKEAAIMKWLDEHFDPQMSIELFLGPEGVTLERNGDMLDYVPTPEGMNYSEFRYGNAPVHVPCIIAADDWGRTIQVMAEDANKLDIADKHYRPYSRQSSLFLIPNLTESRYIQTKGADIDQYANTMQVKWLTEGGIDQEWDEYLDHLNTLGVDEYMTIVQGILDRMSPAN